MVLRPVGNGDVVDRFTLAGVRVVWTSSGGAYRGADRISLVTRDGESLGELGPFARGEARVTFDAIHAALRAAAVVQLDDLKRDLPSRRRLKGAG
jgi:hypothetical protein